MRSPADGLTAAEVISYALMKTTKDEVCIMVEGTKDRDAFAAILRRPPSHCVPARGKAAVIEVAEVIASTKKRRVIGIVDADELSATGGAVDAACPVFTTDYRDLESMHFFSPAGRRVLLQLFDADIVSAIETGQGVDIRTWFARQLAVVGAVRTLNATDDLWISFANFGVAKYADVRSLRLDGRTFLRDVASGSRRIGNPPAFVRKVEELLKRVPPEKLTHGHDLTAFLAVLAAGPRGAGGTPDQSAIEMALRAAYTPWDFRRSALHGHLQDWGRENVDIVLDSDE
ncbi:MAG: hypothetical protein RLZ55_899 [Actinomycetota bacterium]